MSTRLAAAAEQYALADARLYQLAGDLLDLATEARHAAAIGDELRAHRLTHTLAEIQAIHDDTHRQLRQALATLLTYRAPAWGTAGAA